MLHGQQNIKKITGNW